jgi:hypothetical protein
MAPRGFGSLLSTVLTGRVASRIDARLLVGVGLLMLTDLHRFTRIISRLSVQSLAGL